MTGTAPMDPPEILTLAQLQQALNHCMSTHPPEGAERRMHPDAHALAGPWAQMSQMHVLWIKVTELTPEALAAYQRWSRPHE